MSITITLDHADGLTFNGFGPLKVKLPRKGRYPTFRHSAKGNV